MTDRVQGGRFAPGNNGNPGGRPKIPDDIKQAFKAHSRLALATLIRVMRDKKAPHSSKVRAAEAILDRAWGKPAQTIQGDESGAPVIWKMVIGDADK